MSEEAPSVIKAGAFVLLTEGQYADYGICGLGRAKVDLDISALRASFLAAHPENEGAAYRSGDTIVRGFSYVKFVRWLLDEQGLLERVEWTELHLGVGDGKFTAAPNGEWQDA